MFCIRVRPSYSPFVFRENLTTSSILHSNLHVLMRNGEIRQLPFSGFLHIDRVRPLRPRFVKILYIEAFTPDGEFSRFTEIHNSRESYAVGIWDGSGVKVCVYNNRLKTYPLSEEFVDGLKSRNLTNVVRLGDYK